MSSHLRRRGTLVNSITRLEVLLGAYPAVRFLRDGGTSWVLVAKSRVANPTRLTPRQLARLYDGVRDAVGIAERLESVAATMRMKELASSDRRQLPLKL